MKFKVGDKVKIYKLDCQCKVCKPNLNKILIVMGFDFGSKYYYLRYIAEPKYMWIHRDDLILMNEDKEKVCKLIQTNSK